MRVLVFFMASMVVAAEARAADDWPMRFASKKGESFKEVTLFRDGRAAYAARVTRIDGTEYMFVASAADWGVCANASLADRPLCVSIRVTGDDGGPKPVQRRFDYQLHGTTLTMMDPLDSQTVLHVLHRVREKEVAAPLTNRLSGRVNDKVPSSYTGARAARLNR